jgi:outer membrane lipoprotein-sorting protein
MIALKRGAAALIGLSLSFSAMAQTAQEIVSKHLTAIGGEDAWKKITSMISEGNLKVQGAEVTVKMTVLNGKGSRQDISVMGMSGYQIVTPTAGWNYMPFNGQTKPEPITEDAVKESADQLDPQGVLVDYKTKGHTVELLGKEDIEGTEAFKLKVTQKSGKTETVFLDPSSYYILRSVTKQKANGQEMEITTNFSNYKKLPEGIVMPMSITLPFGELTLSKIEVNKPVDEKLFKPDAQ